MPTQGKSFLIRIEAVQDGCVLEVGARFPVLSDKVRIGRNPDADIQLEDMSVSGAHLELVALDDGFRVENLSRRGSTFVNGARLESGESITLSGASTWLQVGRVLLKVAVILATVPVAAAMPLPDEDSTPPVVAPIAPPGMEALERLLVIERSANPRVWIHGNLVQLFPSAARALARLCESPAQLVEQYDLMEALDPDFASKAGGANLNQSITYIRNMFVEAIERDLVGLDELKEAIAACQTWDVVDTDELDPRGLMRVLVTNVRGAGYTLMLPAKAIGFRR